MVGGSRTHLIVVAEETGIAPLSMGGMPFLYKKWLPPALNLAETTRQATGPGSFWKNKSGVGMEGRLQTFREKTVFPRILGGELHGKNAPIDGTADQDRRGRFFMTVSAKTSR
jgi:hypothetical protein